MDSLLIDFNSPKQRREDAPLIPRCLLGSPIFLRSSTCGEESNPFDLVEGQIAANAADQDDPFEMVLNNAMHCQESKKPEVVEGMLLSSLTPFAKNSRKSISLPDLRQCMEMESQKQADVTVSDVCHLNGLNQIENYPSRKGFCIKEYECYDGQTSTDVAEWSCLDDIPPPDQMDATVDMTCFLDDTHVAGSPSLISVSPYVSGEDNLEHHPHGNGSDIENLKLTEDLKASYKSEDELKLFAQKKIENIISKAELEVRSDIQNSLFQKRLSIQLSKPSQEVFALCTPRKSRDSISKPSVDPSWSFQKWSDNELKKLDMILPDSAIITSAPSDIVQTAPDFERDIALFTVKTNRKEEISVPVPSPVHIVTPQKGISTDGIMVCEASEQSSEVSPFSSSPILRPLPLCEDAVRNLSLCSKYSPGPSSSVNKAKTNSKKTENISTATNHENGKQVKLTLRKPAGPSSTQQKMAPMKATAPIQNMTRIRSSLASAPKSDAISSSNATKKSVSKEYSKPNANEKTRFSRLPQSPGRTLSGSLPNLATQGMKLPSRLPSPRRSAGVLHEPVNLRQSLNAIKDKKTAQVSGSTSSFHSSPRPVRNASPCKTGNPPRVLAEINSSTGVRKSPKRRISQLEVPRRGRLIMSEKENLV